MAKHSLFFALSLCFLLLFHAQARRQQYQGQQSQRLQQQCQIQNIDAQEPSRRVQSEAGVTEHWDQNNEQLQCAGVAVIRHTIQPRGLLLPHFHNAHKLTYIVQGRGMHGVAIPGCPETYQSSQQSQQQPYERERERERGESEREQGQGQGQQQSRYRQGDQHQKVRFVRQGDLVATPVGVAQWLYNEGQTPLVMVTLVDTGNNANQLDNYRRSFYLAGNPQRQERQQQQQQGWLPYQSRRPEQEQSSSNNILNGFDDRMLAEVFGVSTETARKLRGENDNRGNIIRVENELSIVRPPRMAQEEEEEEEQPPRYGYDEEDEVEEKHMLANGVEESVCNLKLRTNMDNPSRADVYYPRAGRINRVNSRNLSILRLLQLNAERGVLYRNAIMAPHWNMNAHSVMYVTRGSARVQIVGNYQQPIYDGELRQGQVLVVPQNFAVVKRAQDNGFEWISFKTNDNAMTSPIAGRNSAIRALPEQVLVNAFRISSEQARRLKYNREEMEIFAPRSESRTRFDA